MTPKCAETTSSDFDNLESDSWQITLSVSGSTETSHEDVVVLIDETHTTISWDVSGNSLVVLLQLNSHTLSDGGVWLLGLDGDLLDDDTGSVGSLTEWLLPLGSGVLLLITQIGPSVIKCEIPKCLTYN